MKGAKLKNVVTRFVCIAFSLTPNKMHWNKETP